MISRSIWKGYVQFGLVSVPVKAYTANASDSGVSLNQLHAGCCSRINYVKRCPIHGDVKADEIVHGYQYAKDKYVLISDDEIEALYCADEKMMRVESFIAPESIDSLYLDGKAQYLIPDGAVGEKGFALLRDGLESSGRVAFVRVVVRGKEQLFVMRPAGKVLVCQAVKYHADVKPFAGLEDEVKETTTTSEERSLIKSLIESQTDEAFDLSRFENGYEAKLTALVESKVAGKDVASPAKPATAQVLSLMDALKASVAKASKKPAPKKRMAKVS